MKEYRYEYNENKMRTFSDVNRIAVGMGRCSKGQGAYCWLTGNIRLVINSVCARRY